MDKLALFDFDGTLTTKDSLNEFLKFAVGNVPYIFKLVTFLPTFILYKLKIIPNDIAKQKLIAHFFKDWEKEKFITTAKNFSLTKLDGILNQNTYNTFQDLKATHRIIIISASLKCWLEPWCKQQNVELLCTELEFKNDKVSGKFSTPNCYGMEKVVRLNKYLDIKQYQEIIAFGDSAGDIQMFDISTKYFKITSK